MDKIALRQLVADGVARVRTEYSASRERDAQDGTDVVLDRLVQAGQIALMYEQHWFLDEIINGLLDLYKGASPGDRDALHPPAANAQQLFDIGSRVWILGATAVRQKRFDQIRTIVLQRPVEHWKTYWLRYTVTMAARGEINVFRGKSLIGPISELVREKPQFFSAFDSNLDVTVNALCQFDFLACVVVAAETRSTDGVYPNFGGYYSERTIPIIEELIARGPARAALSDVTDALLAEILYKLNRLTGRAFFAVNGWHGYNERITEFIKKNHGDTHGEE